MNKPIQRINWYRFMLFLPSVLSACLLALCAVLSTWGDVVPHWFNATDTYASIIGFIIACFMAQSFIAIVLYPPFAALITWWGWKKTPSQMYKASWFLPLPFLLLCLACFGSIGLLVIPFGYFYVLLAHALTCLLVRMGVVERRAEHA